MRLSRTIGPVVALVFATATAAAAEPAEKSSKTKTPTEAPQSTQPQQASKAKAHKHHKTAHLKKPPSALLPPLPKSDGHHAKAKEEPKAKVPPTADAKDVKAAPTTKEPTPAAKDAKDEKHPKKTAAVDTNDPPIELTGSLPQAKFVNKKHKDGTTVSDKGKDGVDKAKDDLKSKKASKDGHKKVEKSEKSEKTSAATKPAKTGGLPPLTTPKLGLAKKGPGLKSCLHPSVSFARLGQPNDVAFSLTTCNGKAAPGAIENLSVLGRPYNIPAAPLMPLSVLSLPGKASKPTKALAKPTDEIAPGIRRVDPGLVTRLQAIADHFPGKTITLVSGFRPNSKGSPHAAARAFDLRIDGVTNETLVAFCKTLKDTGCGYYPNSYFVHVDVRLEGAGHVHWIDISGPGEKPHYVKSWPPPLPAAGKPDVLTKADKAKTDKADKTDLTDVKKSGLEDESKLDDDAKSVLPTTDEDRIGDMDGEASHTHEVQ